MEDRLNWILSHLDEFRDCIITRKVMASIGYNILDHEYARFINDHVHNLAFSFLLVLMGEHIPHDLWNIEYCDLYNFCIENDDYNDDGR